MWEINASSLSGLGRSPLLRRVRARNRGSRSTEVVRLVGQIALIDTAVDTDLVRDILEHELPETGPRRRIADELAEHPQRLTIQAAHATAATLRLLRALVNANIGGFVMPPCPFCNRAVELPQVREGLRSCRRCYEQHHAQACARCGAHRPTASRNASGLPICQNCHIHQPENQDTCPGCGERARLYRRAGQQPRCRRCQRAPMAICALCGERNHAISRTPQRRAASLARTHSSTASPARIAARFASCAPAPVRAHHSATTVAARKRCATAATGS